MLIKDILFLLPSAFLYAEGTLYFSVASEGLMPASSPAVNLFQGLFQKYPERARHILRSRVYLTYPPTQMCLGMIKVVGKRFAIVLQKTLMPDVPFLSNERIEYAPDISRKVQFDEKSEFLKGDKCSENDCIQMARSLAEHSSRTGKLHMQDRAVGAVLISAENKILSFGWNTNSENKTLHAEINLLQNYCETTGNKVPSGSKIFTSLKPCKMCAGMIWETAESPSTISVCYFESDTGRFARETILNSRAFLSENNLSNQVLERKFERS